MTRTVPSPYALRQIGDHAKLRAAEIAERHRDRRGHVAGCFCARTFGAHASARTRRRGSQCDAAHRQDAGSLQMARSPRVARSRRCDGGAARGPRRRGFVADGCDVELERAAAFGAHRRERVVERRAQRLPSHRLDQELHPVALLVLVVAARVKHANHRLGDVQHLLDRQEIEQHRRRRGHGRRCRRRCRRGNRARRPRITRAPADVVDGQLDVIVRAAFERDLELARQRRAERMPQQEPRQRLGVRRDVERLVGGDAGELAGGDVADRIAARFARGQARPRRAGASPARRRAASRSGTARSAGS